MGVDKDRSAENRIRDRVEGPGSEWSYCQRYQSGGYQSLKSPVVAPMGGRRPGYRCWIVRSPINDLRACRKNGPSGTGVKACNSEQTRRYALGCIGPQR